MFQEDLAVDEMMVRFYGHHGLNHFLRGKPIRFGFKLWALCGLSNGLVKKDFVEIRPEKVF